MRQRTVSLVMMLALAGCGGDGFFSIPEGDAGPLEGAAPEGDAPDAGMGDAPSSEAGDGGAPAKCADAGGLGGVGIPAMSVATASSPYMNHTPEKAIDGDINTWWSAGGTQGWLQIDFPAPVWIDGVRLAAGASPSTTENFTITPSGSATVIGSGMRTVSTNVVLAPFPVTPGNYSGIRITIDQSSAWVGLNEVTLLNSSCP